MWAQPNERKSVAMRRVEPRGSSTQLKAYVDSVEALKIGRTSAPATVEPIDSRE
jgi:hypothetical protein